MFQNTTNMATSKSTHTYVSLPEILATKEQRKLKENGNTKVSEQPFTPPGIGIKHSARIFRERNDGQYAAFNEQGERLFYSVSPKVIRELETLVVEA